MRSSAVAALLASALSVARPSVCVAQPVHRMLVMPFENVTRDSRLVWVREAASLLVTDNLTALGVDAISREERHAAFVRLQIPPTTPLTDATVIRIGQLVGASHVVVGVLRYEGDTLVVGAKAIALDAARVESRVTERGALPDIFAVFERVAHGLAPGSPLGREGGRDHPILTAFEHYVKGLIAETPGPAISFLTAALREQPAFDGARLALWEVHDTQGDHEQALAAAFRVSPGSAAFRRARFLVGLSQTALKRNNVAFQTFKSLAATGATPALLNNLGVVQLRLETTPQGGRPTDYFRQAADADATDPDYFFNLGYASWRERDIPAAILSLREALRRAPADGDAHYVLGAALTAAGSPVEANREKDLARRLSSTYAEWEKRPDADAVPKGLERIKRDIELPRVAGIGENIASAGQRDQQALATFYLERGRRLYLGEHDRDALAELRRALFLSPYQAEAHLLAGRIHLRAGRAREAIDALKISLWSAETAEAHAVLAEAYLEVRDLASARSEAQRATALDPTSRAGRLSDTQSPR